MTVKQSASPGYLYTLFGICFLGGVFGGITSALMSAYLPDVVKALSGSTTEQKLEEISAVINAAYLFGMTAGGLSLGYFCDRYGRKKGLQLSMFFIGLFTLLTAFAHNWVWVVGLRFLTGAGVGGILVATTILIAEVWTNAKRNIALGILSITIPVGIFSAGLITYNFSNWRHGFTAGALPLLLAVLSQWVIRESDKWKVGRVEQAVVKSPSIFDGGNAYDLLFGSLIYGTMLIGLWAVFLWLPTWVQTVVPQGSDGQQERGISMILFATGGLLGGIGSGWVSNLVGMKKSMLVCFAACFILSVALFRFNTELTVWSYVLMALIALFFGISQGVLNAYIPALFPTLIRSAATGFCFNIGRIFTASAVFFVGWLVSVLGGYANSLTLFSCVFGLGFIVTLKVKERSFIP